MPLTQPPPPPPQDLQETADWFMGPVSYGPEGGSSSATPRLAQPAAAAVPGKALRKKLFTTQAGTLWVLPTPYEWQSLEEGDTSSWEQQPMRQLPRSGQTRWLVCDLPAKATDAVKLLEESVTSNAEVFVCMGALAAAGRLC